MKKTVLASTLTTLLFAGAAQAATVYQDDSSSLDIGGRAEARFNVSDNNKVGENGLPDGNSSFEDISRARIDIEGKTQIMPGLGAFGTYKMEVGSGGEESVDTRYLFAGIDTHYGAFSYGKQDSAQVILTDFTDILATFGGDAADLIDANSDELKNNFVYAGTFDALTITANYIANDEKDSDNYGISFVYSLPMGLDIGVGYVDGQESDVDADQVNLAGAYTYNDFYFAAIYTDGSLGEADLKAYEIAAAYKINQLTLQGVYNFQENDSTDTVDYYALEGVYKFNSSFRAYAGYRFEQIDDLDDQVQAGVRYDF